ncbi:MAG: 16S rRNA (adenine(1518)-N(6)/adenine(1519)-N(6))-dimethyltransferase RsmA, partial [Pseudomonadota bacterium]
MDSPDAAAVAPLSAVSQPDDLPPLRAVIAALDLGAKKNLGQNFILDLNLTQRIAGLGGPLTNRVVIEIGPGPGGLTRALLLRGAAHVIAIERDERVRPALAQLSMAWPGGLTTVFDDAAAVDVPSLVAALPAPLNAAPVSIIANLPYGIATKLLTGWLETSAWPPWFDTMVLMFQREVADRIVAAPGTKSYGRLAVLSQWRCHVERALTLQPEAFTPPPKVDSAVVVLRPRPMPDPATTPEALAAVTAAAFGQRR